MAKSLREYMASLDERGELWPRLPAADPPKATPSVGPLPGVRAVLWNVYGTLMRIADGELLHVHPQQLRMQVALEKTVHEFNMWQSMFRTPQQPWEYMLERWTKAIAEARLTTATGRKGDVPALDSSKLWRRLIGELEKKEFRWDEDLAEDADDLAEKVAYYFHARLQGVAASPHALQALEAVGRSNVRQGVLADTQPFTVNQLMRVLALDGPVPPPGELFEPTLLVQSHLVGCAKPSPTLFETAVARLAQLDITPEETLVVSNRTTGDIAVAKTLGFRTALYAADKVALQFTAKDVKNPATKPDRLLTDLAQIREITRIA
jgi:FMN phosphatase YigB (HAD superfamily)